MIERIRLVQGDTRPQVVVEVLDQARNPIDCSDSTVKLYFRRKGGPLLTTIQGVLLTGRVNLNGSINVAAPYNVPGSGGRVAFNWPPNALNISPGMYQGEVEITYPDGTVQTVFDLVPFKVRAQF